MNDADRLVHRIEEKNGQAICDLDDEGNTPSVGDKAVRVFNPAGFGHAGHAIPVNLTGNRSPAAGDSHCPIKTIPVFFDPIRVITAPRSKIQALVGGRTDTPATRAESMKNGTIPEKSRVSTQKQGVFSLKEHAAI